MIAALIDATAADAQNADPLGIHVGQGLKIVDDVAVIPHALLGIFGPARFATAATLGAGIRHDDDEPGLCHRRAVDIACGLFLAAADRVVRNDSRIADRRIEIGRIMDVGGDVPRHAGIANGNSVHGAIS